MNGRFAMARELTVKDILDTMTQAQKNTLYYYVGKALMEKVKIKSPCAAIESFDENQKKVFYYLVGCALDENLKNDTLEIVKGDN
jgi:hypothetical protein